jgi:hypothetical protein
MDFRGRDLLRAEARFLRDFCGEDAVRRWRERLTDAEQDLLVPASTMVREYGRALVEAVQRMLRAVLDALSWFMRPIVGTIAVAYAALTGQAPDAFGRQAS